MLQDAPTMATRDALAPAPSEPHNSSAPAGGFSSFHRTLQEGTLAKLISTDFEYWGRLSEYHDQFDQLTDARAAVQAQADVVISCAAVMEGLHVRARADQSIISDRLGPMTIRDLDDVNTLLRLSKKFEREVVAPFRARVYPDLAWSTAVPCLPVDREEQLPNTARDMLGHDTIMNDLFHKPEPDSSQRAVDAARDYLEAVVKLSVQPAAAPRSLAANRRPLHTDIRPFGQIWLTTLQRFAPGPEDPFCDNTVEHDSPSIWQSAILYTAIGPNGATGPQSLDVQAGDRILMVGPDKSHNNVVEAHHLTPRHKDSLTHGFVSYAGCLVDGGKSIDISAICTDASEAAEPEPPTVDQATLAFKPSATRFVDATERYVTYRRALQDVVAIVAVRVIRGMNELALRTDALRADMHQHVEEEHTQMDVLQALQSECEVRTRKTRQARGAVAVVEPSYFDAILWLIILSRTPA